MSEGAAASTSGAPSARARQKQETRRALLAAAQSLFGEHSPATTPLEDVAAAAGVSKATLFFHFGTRHDLLAALATRLYLRATVEDEVEGDTLRPFLDRWLARQARDDIRLLWRIGDLLNDDPELLDAAYRHLESQLMALVTGPRARRAQLTAVLTPALMLVGRRAASGLATKTEVRRFVDAAVHMAEGVAR